MQYVISTQKPRVKLKIVLFSNSILRMSYSSLKIFNISNFLEKPKLGSALGQPIRLEAKTHLFQYPGFTTRGWNETFLIRQRWVTVEAG